MLSVNQDSPGPLPSQRWSCECTTQVDEFITTTPSIIEEYRTCSSLICGMDSAATLGKPLCIGALSSIWNWVGCNRAAESGTGGASCASTCVVPVLCTICASSSAAWCSTFCRYCHFARPTGFGPRARRRYVSAQERGGNCWIRSRERQFKQ